MDNKIKQYRISKGLSQNELAEKLFVTRQAVSKWELGKAVPDLDTLKKLSEIFECDLEDLMQLDNVTYAINDNIVKLNKVNRLQKIIITIMSAIMVVLLTLSITLPLVIFYKMTPPIEDEVDDPLGVIGFYIEVNGDGKMSNDEIGDKRDNNAFLYFNPSLYKYVWQSHNIETFAVKTDGKENVSFSAGNKLVEVYCSFTFTVKENELPLIEIWQLVDLKNGKFQQVKYSTFFLRETDDKASRVIDDRKRDKGGAYFYIKIIKLTEQTTSPE